MKKQEFTLNNEDFPQLPSSKPQTNPNQPPTWINNKESSNQNSPNFFDWLKAQFNQAKIFFHRFKNAKSLIEKFEIGMSAIEYFMNQNYEF